MIDYRLYILCYVADGDKAFYRESMPTDDHPSVQAVRRANGPAWVLPFELVGTHSASGISHKYCE